MFEITLGVHAMEITVLTLREFIVCSTLYHIIRNIGHKVFGISLSWRYSWRLVPKSQIDTFCILCDFYVVCSEPHYLTKCLCMYNNYVCLWKVDSIIAHLLSIFSGESVAPCVPNASSTHHALAPRNYLASCPGSRKGGGFWARGYETTVRSRRYSALMWSASVTMYISFWSSYLKTHWFKSGNLH